MGEKSFRSKIESGCLNPEQHRDHLCLLMEKGLTGEIRKRTAQPAFVCGNCGARANEREALCNPTLLEAP